MLFANFLLLLHIFNTVYTSSVEKRLLLQVSQGISIGTVANTDLDEASGLCASRQFPGILYTHNDKGGQNRIFAIDSATAQVIAVLVIDGATNTDWEDIACGKCFGHTSDNCLYIGDIGDAGGHGSATTIYRVQEPAVLNTLTHVSVEAELHYSWGEINAETLMVTPEAELYIVSKVHGGKGLIAHIPGSGWGSNSPIQLNSSHRLDVTTTHNDPLGGDISPDGQEVLIKVRNYVLHYNTNGSKDFEVVLSGSPVNLPYVHEKHGEAVAFSLDGQTYYTLAEGHHPTLYRYNAKI
ncbi:uncharacterized protein LOC132713071 [Ruditapes philippinarum]|uniref:uncharacterized protein LOC132713071 n=1 Tax=Ruditapes philippinarum TaxID=129788 RepID=UPI00295ACC40|nr:uncharacterized protein LOC132713071 [Ruditapes philippinarum]